MQGLFDRLTQQGLLSESAAADALKLIEQGQRVDTAVLSVDGLTAEQLLPAMAAEFGVEYLVDLDGQIPDKQLLKLMPAAVLTQFKLLPLSKDGQRVRIATASIFEMQGFDELRLATGLELLPVLAPRDAIDRALRKYLGVGAETVQSLVAGADDILVVDEDSDGDVDLADAAQDASIIKFVNQVLVDAIERRATDVHFEPFEHRLSVRFRIDGVLVDADIPADVRRFQPAIVSRLKILSHLDIAEKRLPQDGRIKLKVGGKDVDVRVSVIPMLHGEAVVLRLLDRSTAMTGLEGLGMAGGDLQTFERILGLPHGIVLVTGPTGSGKTTTLYASLARINDVERKIVTIEDPIEYHLEGINQIQVDEKTGMTFARGLRAILRHDPDVVLIGEIRDRETAQIAVQASLTGHLVFSTLHTNDAPGAITRLIDMGVEPFLVSSSLEMVAAQRLVRLICPYCKAQLPEAEAARVRAQLGDVLPGPLYHGKGCDACSGSGYRGREGIFELMPMTDELRTMVTDRVAAQLIRKTAVAQGMHSLREDGLRLVRAGKTTIEEVLRVTKDEAAGAGPTNASSGRVN